MNQDFAQAAAWVAALTGDANTVLDWRAIHDTNKGVPAFLLRGVLSHVWNELCSYNRDGRGIFAMLNETDGLGREIQNVTRFRTQVIDNDKGGIETHQRAQGWSLKPHMFVTSSPGKFHEYWLVEPYSDAAKYNAIQQKLITLFDSDPSIWDAPRVLRVPGFFHMKNPQAPHLVTVAQGSGWGQARYTAEQFEYQLAGVVASGSGGADAHGLGDPALAAPSLEWATRTLNAVDPNTIYRDEWIKLTAAFKQAAWGFGEPVARFIWDQWCFRYKANDKAENDKQWRSIRSTKAGWPFLLKSSGLFAEFRFGAGPGAMPVAAAQPVAPVGAPAGVMPHQVVQAAVEPAVAAGGGTLDTTGNFMLTPQEQAEYFAGCTLITKDGRILTPHGRFLDPSKFNAQYGGKAFIHTVDGKTTDEPWKAATRGQVYQVQKADHIRFLPTQANGAIIVDELGRKGVNTYIPARITMQEGDPTPFVSHIRAILSTEQDALILLNFFARIAQSPGVKIPWAPVIQSTPGVGKNVIKYCMSHVMGSVYTYYPNAQELTEGGGKFNAWMRSKLFILCDEVKTDDRRDMLEVLKPLISEKRIEIQGKGVDQDLEDNFANWLFFTNWEDAIPIDKNERRYSINYSPMQSVDDLERAGLNSAYFNQLYDWIENRGGAQIVAHYLKHFVIDPALDPALNQRAPITSSTAKAIVKSRTAPEAAIYEAIETGRSGFRGGWISSAALQMLLDEQKIRVSHTAVGRIIENMGYKKIGRSGGAYPQEGYKQPNLYHHDPNADIRLYGKEQGYPN